MIKTVEFFIERATEYKGFFENAIENYVDPFSSGFGDNSEYTKQQDQISSMKTKVKLMFSEFDNGTPLIDEINSIEKNIVDSFYPKKKLASYVRVIDLFIDHLKTFRV